MQRALHVPGADVPSDSQPPASAASALDELQIRGLGNRIAAGLGNSIAALRERNDALVGSFQQLLAGLLGENGFDFGDGLTIEPGDAGRIKINGPHPDASEIEALLNSTPDLRQLFNQIADNARLIHEFDAGRPPAAFGQPNRSQSRFQLLVNSSGSEGSFTSPVTANP